MQLLINQRSLATSPRTTAPANSEDIDAFIIDNPFQQYNVQLDTRLAATAILAQAEMGSTFGLTVSANGAGSAGSGSTISGQSNSQLTVGTGATVFKINGDC